MGILTANLNFLASLGITTSEQFTAAFGDMAAFTEYCDEIGYSWEIDENNDLILITPNGNTVNTYIEVEAKTATPTITVTPGDTAYTIEATGEGTVKLYIDDVEVFNPVSIERTTESQEITVTATAQAEGKEISDEAEEEIVIPALDTTAAPDIEAIPGLDSYDIVALGDGTVKLYLGGNEVANPYTVVRTDQNQTLTFSATAQEVGKQISETTEEEFVIPALPVSDTPVITATKRDADYLISVSAGQDAVINITCDGEAMANPFVITRGNSNTTVTIIATATEPHHSMATTSQQVLIEALPVTATPTISVATGLTTYTVTATGNGTVLLYADGVATQNPCSISRTTTSQTIVFTATAQEVGKQISATATETVTVPAMEVTATPVITYDSTTFTVDVTGNGTVLSYVDGVATQMPHTFTQGASAQTYVVTATAQEVGKQISATATENCLVPAAAPVPNYLKMSVLNESGNDGNITISIPASVDSTIATSISYSKNGINWTDTAIDNTAQTITIPVSAGDNVYLKGIATQWCAQSYAYGMDFTVPVNFNISGNIMSLLYGDNFANQTTFPSGSQYTFKMIFNALRKLIDASQLELPATTLVPHCYSGMFRNCSSLTSAPALPATTLAEGCYAAKLNTGQSYGMFEGCTSLTTAPALPATTLARGCYNRMFLGCTSLTTAPTLPAMTAVEQCYSGMFSGCTSLTTAPALPATTLGNYSYSDMFLGCTSLTTAPALPATTLAEGCYHSMFRNCSSLTTAPALPATTLGNYSYRQMFENCTSLTTAPALPATNLVAYCYYQTFKGCTSLTTAPVLPATVLKEECYNELFRNCSSLNSITMLAEDISAYKCLYAWVGSVAATGTFTKAASMTTLPTGASGIPTGWTVVDYGVVPNYMKLSVLNESGNDGNITITIPAQITSAQATSLSYSKDGSNWTDTAVDSTAQTITIPVNAGDEVYLKGVANQWGTGGATGTPNYTTTIDSSANFNVGGNIMSLFGGDNFENLDKVSNCALARLFSNNTHIINAGQLELPGTHIYAGCYYNMFQGCTTLTSAPALPATILDMNCYGGMFKDCTSLTTAPALPTTTLATSCYANMFQGCTSLTTSPALPATTLAQSCYRNMFNGCRNLNSITMLAENISASNCLNNWVNGVAATGTFTKSANMTTLPTGISGIPDGWTVVDYTT